MVARICDLSLYLHYHCTPTIRKQILADLWTCAAHSNPDFRNGMWSIDVECCGKFDTPFEFHRFPIFHRGGMFVEILLYNSDGYDVARNWTCLNSTRCISTSFRNFRNNIFWTMKSSVGERSNRFSYQYLSSVVIQVSSLRVCSPLLNYLVFVHDNRIVFEFKFNPGDSL